VNVHVLATSASFILVIAAVQACVALAIGILALTVRALKVPRADAFSWKMSGWPNDTDAS
jgi:hypothetical protein